MAVEGAFFETMVEELLHQRLGVRERDQALTEVTRRKNSIFVAQPARRAAVVGDGHDRGQVGGVGLEASQQRAQTGAAADRDDARPAAAQPECVDHLDHAARVRPGEKWTEDGLRELQVTDHEQPDAEDAEHDRTRPVGQELQRDPIEALRQVGCLVDLLEGVRNAEHEDQLGHHEQEEPAFDLQPGREPAKPTRG